MADLANVNLRAELQGRLGPLTTLKLGIVLYFIQIALLINGTYITQGGFSRDVALIYILLPLGFIAYSYKSREVVEDIELWHSVKWAMVGFIITPVVVLTVYYYGLGTTFGSTPKNEVLGTILTMALFVAPVEELCFRQILPNYLERNFPKNIAIYGLILSQVFFALFHWGVYGNNFMLFVIAFIIGMIWLGVSRIKLRDGKRLGIGFTIGSHCAYNLIVSGILVGNITTVVT